MQALSSALGNLTSQVPTLTGNLAPVAPTLTTNSSLLFALEQFIATAQSVDTLLWLLYVSLTVTGLAVLLLAGRMVAMRRRGELTVIRARGASLRQIAVSTAGGAALVCVPAAVIAVVLAILAVPGAGSVQAAGAAGGWWPPIAVLVVAVGGPALIAAWQHRLPKPGITDRRQTRARTRLIVEVMLIAAAVAGLVVFRNQGSQAGSGVNLYTSSAPVLVAIPVVIVVLRLYPLVLRGLLRALDPHQPRARVPRPGPGLQDRAHPRAARVRPGPRAHRGRLRRHGQGRGDQRRGRGVLADGRRRRDRHARAEPHHPRERRAGDRRRARRQPTRPQVWNALWETPAGAQLNVLAVDPASYAALVAAARGSRRCRPASLAVPSRAGAPQPVLASPQALADLGRGVVSLATYQGQEASIPVQVAGVVVEHARAARRAARS